MHAKSKRAAIVLKNLYGTISLMNIWIDYQNTFGKILIQ